MYTSFEYSDWSKDPRTCKRFSTSKYTLCVRRFLQGKTAADVENFRQLSIFETMN